MKKDFGFEPIEEEVDEFGFVPEESTEDNSEKTSALYAGALGASSGATLGFGDEAGAGLMAVLDKIAQPSKPSKEDVLKYIAPKTKEKISPEDIKVTAPEQSIQEAYKKYLKVLRDQDKKAMSDQPLSYLSGALAGGAAIPGAAAAKGVGTLGKIAKGAKTGAILGGIGSAGAAEDVDLTTPEGTYEAALDVAKGAALGGTIGAAIPATGKAIKSGGDFLGDLDVSKIFKKRAGGLDLKSSLPKSEQALKELGEETSSALRSSGIGKKPKIVMKGDKVVKKGKPVRTPEEKAIAQKYKEFSGRSIDSPGDPSAKGSQSRRQQQFLMKADPKADRRQAYDDFMKGFNDPTDVQKYVKGLDEVSPDLYRELSENAPVLAENIRLGRILKRPIFTTAGVGKGMLPAIGAGIESGAAHAANWAGMLTSGGRSTVSQLGQSIKNATPETMQKFARNLSDAGYSTLAKPFMQAASSQEATNALVAEMVKADERDNFFETFGGATEEAIDLTGAVLGTMWNSTFGYEAPEPSAQNIPQHEKINKAIKFSTKAAPEEFAQMSEQVVEQYGKDASQLSEQLKKLSETDDPHKRRAISFAMLQNPASRKMLGIS